MHSFIQMDHVCYLTQEQSLAHCLVQSVEGSDFD